MRSRIAFILIFLGISGGIIQVPVQTQGAIKEIFVSEPFIPSDFSSYNVDATVFGEGLSGCQVADDPPNDRSSKAYTTGIINAIGWGEKAGDNFVFFTGAANCSADAWAEIHFTDPKGVPANVGPEAIDSVGIRIRGKIKKADTALAICGASWTQEFGYININGLHGDLLLFRVGGHPPDPCFDFDPCIPGPQAAKGIARALEIIPKVIALTGMLMDALNAVQVYFNQDEDFEAFFGLPVSIKPEEINQKLLNNQPLDINIQLGFRSSAVLGSVALTGGIIRIDEIEVVGLAIIEPVVHLEIWHYYHQEQLLVKRLVAIKEYNIKQKLLYNIGEYPEVTVTCPIPYPMAPSQRIQGRLYSIIGDWYWRLDYIMLNDDERLRQEVQSNSCSYGPIRMSQSHKLIFGFERAAADLVIDDIRTEPSLETLQQGQRFTLNVLVRNSRELSTLQADRSVPLYGDYQLLIRVNGEELKLHEAPLDAAGDPQNEDVRELFAGSWEAPHDSQMTIEITIDADDEIDEGISGEQNNVTSYNIPLSISLPDLAFKDPQGDVGFTEISPNILRLHASVSNLSPIPASEAKVRFTAMPAGQEYGGKIIGERTIPLIAGNSSETVEFDWDATAEPPGEYTIIVEIDPDNKIQEIDDLNNSATFAVTLVQQCAKLETDRKEYKPGELATILLTNNCQGTLSLENSAPWVIKDSQGRVVFSPLTSGVITEVQPGETESWAWDQKGNDQKQVPDGNYTVELKTMDGGIYTVSFEIKAKGGMGFPDLAFKDPQGDVGFTEISPNILRLHASVSNLSPIPASEAKVRFTAMPAGQEYGGKIIGERTIPLIAGNSSETVEFDWDATAEPPGEYTIIVEIDPDNKIQEIDDLNNSATFAVTLVQQCAKLETDRKEYKPGELATILLTNNCQGTLSLENSAPWVIKDSQGRVVFSPLTSGVITEVQPGETESWAWDQKGNDQKQVPDGNYTVELKTMDGGIYTVSFEIKAKGGMGLGVLLILMSFVLYYLRNKRNPSS